MRTNCPPRFRISALRAVILIALLISLFPRESASAQGGSCLLQDRSSTWVETENIKSGDAHWRDRVVVGWVGDGTIIPLNRYATNTFADAQKKKSKKEPRKERIQGWFDKTSVSCGDSVGLHLSGRNKSATVTLYRLGYYGGIGARKVWEISLANVPPQESATVTAAPERTVSTKWPVSVSIPISNQMPPGEYVARLDDGGPATFAPLLIKDESARSPLVLISSVLTWQAYNHFGGYSLYKGAAQDHSTRSRVVSFDRPYDGNGAGQIFVHEFGVIKTAEKLGLDITYLTDLDIDAKPALLKEHTSIIFGGHAEYWTRPMRGAVLSARDSGTNIIVLGANTGYWKTRLQNNGREVAVWRDNLDPYRSDALKVTNQWRNGPAAQPESEILGSAYAGLGVKANYQVVRSSAWPIAGTTLKAGAIIKGVVGREVDSPDRDPGPGVQLVLSTNTKVRGRVERVGMTYYTTKSGSGVLDASTDGWVCSITNSCNWTRITKESSLQVEEITAQILKESAKGPLGSLHPAVIDIPAAAR